MKFENDQFKLSATDLVKHLACRHLTILDLQEARGEIERPFFHDPGAAALEQRGLRHEVEYLSHLKEQGIEILEREGPEAEQGLERTLVAMTSGIPVIAQAYLEEGIWRGRADVLLRIDKPSKLGNWSYEVVDTKLARETRGGTILQLCLYSELVATVQGCMPEHMHVVTPGRDFQPATYRLDDYLAYYRLIKLRLENEITANPIRTTYPERVEHCEICQWWVVCNERRRTDDHLSFVAGISRLHINELRLWGVNTLADLAAMPLPLQTRPKRGSPDTFIKVRGQARVQLESRTTQKPVHELFDPEPERGLARLPEPSPGDIFLDFESDPFVDDGGLEYLLGYVEVNEPGEAEYTRWWALNRVLERQMFESFIDMIMDRRSRFPNMHIYHFTHYEPTALKRMMGRYATREDEMDRILRARMFVDLHGILKQTLRASVERYSLKDLEIFFDFRRTTELRDAKRSLRALESALELNDAESLPREVLEIVEAYNREDCISTLHLRNWLEKIRSDLVSAGNEIARPVIPSDDPSEAVEEGRRQVLALMERLLDGVPDNQSERTQEQQATWLIAHLLEWHRREDKAPWWEYFRLQSLTDEELMEEKSAISGLQFLKRTGGTEECPVHRYEFPLQDAEVRKGDHLESSTGKLGTVEAISIPERNIDIKKRSATADTHPTSVFAYKIIGAKALVESLLRLGNWIADNGIDAGGDYRAGRDLLLRRKPRLKTAHSKELYSADLDIVAEARRLALQLDRGVLPIQGPPGAGKTLTGARMICELIGANKKVGITAMSHKVIRKLLDEVLNACEPRKSIRCIQKVAEESEVENPAIIETTKNKHVIDALQNGEAQLVAGTAWLWARPEFAQSVDVLFVDEAGQMSLADVLAVSQAADSIVLLGDPQQLEQPLQGTHPPGVAVSALQHILGTEKTMPPDCGLFLRETWRLCPAICDLTSELFYENRLNSREGLERQTLTGSNSFEGSGLWFIPVDHSGNQSNSVEEVEIVAGVVQELIRSNTSWIDMNGQSHLLGLNDILIVAPYNAQISRMAERFPKGARIGTVDKFQGQEAPVVIYSMATSSPEDAPRGMEFLYSLNRFNVATSRARCACILVANPKLFEPECKSPHQMKLANALCRYLEMAKVMRIR